MIFLILLPFARLTAGEGFTATDRTPRLDLGFFQEANDTKRSPGFTLIERPQLKTREVIEAFTLEGPDPRLGGAVGDR